MLGTEAWEGLLQRWVQAVLPSLEARSREMGNGDCGVMTIPLDLEKIQRMLGGRPERFDPVWQPADKFIRLLREEPGPISADSIARWEQMLAVMDPRRDAALFLMLTANPDESGPMVTRFIVTHDGSVPVN
jgi:hypothetical protein